MQQFIEDQGLPTDHRPHVNSSIDKWTIVIGSTLIPKPCKRLRSKLKQKSVAK